MKKFICILLLVLPIFLMVTISLAGRIFSVFVYIKVERVAFVDHLEEEIDLVKVGKGDTLQLQVKVFPDFANNKNVEYTSLNEEIVTISRSGEIEGLDYGFATILVKTFDGYKTDRLTVNVTDDFVESIDIDLSEKELYLYQSFVLTSNIFPATALDKKIYWSSSNPEYVSVDANGKVTANKITPDNMEVIITATTRDGEKTDSCVIKVLPHLLAFKPQIENNASTYTSHQLSIDLYEFVIYDTNKINKEDIEFQISSGESVGNISDGVLTFNANKAGEPMKLKVFVDKPNLKIESQIYLRYLPEN